MISYALHCACPQFCTVKEHIICVGTSVSLAVSVFWLETTLLNNRNGFMLLFNTFTIM